MRIRIEKLTMLFSEDCEVIYIAMSKSSDALVEMLKYCFGEKGTFGHVYDDTFSTDAVDNIVQKFAEAGVSQGYITDAGVVVEFKTRKEMLDDVLNELEPTLYMSATINKNILQ